MDEFEKLSKMFDEAKRSIKHFYFGKSAWGQRLCCFELGHGRDCILMQGGMHAREYITSFLLLKMAFYLEHFDLPVRVYIVPIMNPDGLELCLKGNEVLSRYSRNKAFQKCKESVKFVLGRGKHFLVKCNGRGVDLNVNFGCDFGQGKHNFFGYPSAENYVGARPNSESETRALIILTKKLKPFVTVSYHSKGEVIYYGYKGQDKKTRQEQKMYLRCFSKAHYKKVFTKNSCGGYKDYCLMRLGITAFTVEVGNDNLLHPIKSSNLDKIFGQNKNIVLKLIKTKLKDNLCKNII